MRISRKTLQTQARITGFRPDVLEKVAQLLGLLNAIESHPFLKGKLALKGGTALNLFFFDIPRLSVDIDLNYIGSQDRDEFVQDKPKIEQALQAVFSREGFTVRHIPDEHAGGKWQLQYQSTAGQTSNLQVDVNYMFRVPLWPVVSMASKKLGAWQAEDIPVVDFHELAAGKLVALLSRKQARDLFDCCEIYDFAEINRNQLRTAFVVYGAMNRKDWRTISIDDIDFEPDELARQLIPTLSQDAVKHLKDSDQYGQSLVAKCKKTLSSMIPFTDSEIQFLNLLLDKGQIKADLLTNDKDLQDQIAKHPMLQWKALNVRKHKNLPE
ncbi:MAG: nucleotidyl transferase AbiEii/AbiGii toxin family protein [Planctomycetota bacterium]|jgi:predicted nucleotidyltransferase component of viral defense system